MSSPVAPATTPSPTALLDQSPGLPDDAGNDQKQKTCDGNHQACDETDWVRCATKQSTEVGSNPAWERSNGFVKHSPAARLWRRGRRRRHQPGRPCVVVHR